MSAPSLSLNELKRLIVESLKLDDIPADSISDDEPLFGGRFGLDSIDALELVVALENRLGVKIRAHEMDAAAFASVAGMHRHLERRLATTWSG